MNTHDRDPLDINISTPDLQHKFPSFVEKLVNCTSLNFLEVPIHSLHSTSISSALFPCSDYLDCYPSRDKDNNSKEWYHSKTYYRARKAIQILTAVMRYTMDGVATVAVVSTGLVLHLKASRGFKSTLAASSTSSI